MSFFDDDVFPARSLRPVRLDLSRQPSVSHRACKPATRSGPVRFVPPKILNYTPPRKKRKNPVRLQAVLVAVNYDDLLSISLSHNAQHFEQIHLATTPWDTRTKAIAARFPNVGILETECFFDKGASFCKGAAVEKLTERLDPDVWTVIWDADIVMPAVLPFDVEKLDRNDLYTPRRCQVHDRIEYLSAAGKPELDTSELEELPDQEQAGYFQLFHPRSMYLKERPWYTPWKHAGGTDSDFLGKFPEDHRHWMGFQVLHLGQPGVNWQGRVTKRWDGHEHLQGPGMLDPVAAKAAQEEMYRLRSKFGTRNEKLS